MKTLLNLISMLRTPLLMLARSDRPWLAEPTSSRVFRGRRTTGGPRLLPGNRPFLVRLTLLLVPLLLLASWVGASEKDEIAGKKVFECPYIENLPYGVMGWSQSEVFKNPKLRESRFSDYNSDSAKELILDATTERDVTKDEKAAYRKTTFSMAFNDKGWYIYIEGEEPLINDLLDSLVDPKSPGHKEGYEIFFTPGLHRVPYYQIMTRPFGAEPRFIDWGMSHRHYRSLRGLAKVESLRLENGAGTFLFIPWEALYDWLPLDANYWRFSIVRWMPYGKAGGVTWGGRVHETGSFGLIHFQEVTPEQRFAIEKRLLRTAWFKFLATSKAQAEYWADEKVGAPKFYETVLKPEIEKETAAGEALGDPKNWTKENVAQGHKFLSDWMEFTYKVGELRRTYLLDQRFTEAKNP